MPSLSPAARPADSLPPATHAAFGSADGGCANCDAPLHGPYCAACGQHAMESDRLTFRVLWGEFRRRFLHLEFGLLLTLRHMAFKPGHVIGRYLRGERKRYVNPLGFVVMATAFNLLVHALTGYRERMLGELESMTVSTSDSGRSLEETMQAFMTWSMEYSTYLTVIVCLFVALFLRLFLGRKMRIAEGLVFGLFCYGQVTVWGALAELPYIVWPNLPWDMTYELFFDTGLLFVIACVAAYQMFEKWGAVVLTALSVGLGYVGYAAFRASSCSGSCW